MKDIKEALHIIIEFIFHDPAIVEGVHDINQVMKWVDESFWKIYG